MVKMANEVHISAQIMSPASLNCREIKKKQLAEWLYTAYYLLDRCSLPLMGLAAKQNAQLENSMDEKITDQSKIIELQNKLIEKEGRRA